MNSEKSRQYLWLITPLLFGCVFLYVGLGDTPLIDWDENIFAEASRQMVIRNDYMNIIVNDHSFAEKPPFYYWEQALSYHIFGINEFAARFPSTVAALAMILVCFYFGRFIDSYQTGGMWSMIYLTSLLPSSFARSVNIDHTFNFFISTSTLLLYLFDLKYGKYLDRKQGKPGRSPHWNHWILLTLSGICLGLGVLTKGPVGGVIPLVGFAGYKLFYRYPRINPVHFFYLAILSLSIALSWYLANWIAYGGSFIDGFIEFQLLMFTSAQEGHQGPFFYHFVVVFLGFLPWTPFIFSLKPKQLFGENKHFRPLFVISCFWFVFVLTLFSIVSNKLPHYSASVYFPLSLFVAIIFRHHLQQETRFSRRVLVMFLFLNCSLAVLTMFLPELMKSYLRSRGIVLDIVWSAGVYYTALGVMAAIVVGSYLYNRRKMVAGLWVTAFAMLILTQGFWRFHIPPFLMYNQQPMLEMVEEAHRKGSELIFYRYVSFAALFYGKEPIEMLHTYKFPGKPEILNHRGIRDKIIITAIAEKVRLKTEHPLVHHVRDHGAFSMFRIPKK